MTATSKRELLFVVHGINDNGEWVRTTVRPHLETGPSDTPYMTVIDCSYKCINERQLMNSLQKYSTEIVTLEETITRSIRDYGADCDISFFAHSFGTYLVSAVLERKTTLRINRIVFAGAIVNRSYGWQAMSHRIGPSPPEARSHFLNLTGTADHWPLMAELDFGDRYGASGTHGFLNASVENCCQRGDHSSYLKGDYIERVIKPFLHQGIIPQNIGRCGDEIDWYWRFAYKVGLTTKWFRFIIALILLAIFSMIGYFYGSAIVNYAKTAIGWNQVEVKVNIIDGYSDFLANHFVVSQFEKLRNSKDPAEQQIYASKEDSIPTLSKFHSDRTARPTESRIRGWEMRNGSVNEESTNGVPSVLSGPIECESIQKNLPNYTRNSAILAMFDAKNGGTKVEVFFDSKEEFERFQTADKKVINGRLMKCNKEVWIDQAVVVTTSK